MNFIEHMKRYNSPDTLCVVKDGVYHTHLLHDVYEFEELGLVTIDPNGLENARIKFVLTKSGKALLEFDKL